MEAHASSFEDSKPCGRVEWGVGGILAACHSLSAPQSSNNLTAAHEASVLSLQRSTVRPSIMHLAGSTCWHLFLPLLCNEVNNYCLFLDYFSQAACWSQTDSLKFARRRRRRRRLQKKKKKRRHKVIEMKKTDGRWKIKDITLRSGKRKKKEDKAETWNKEWKKRKEEETREK